MDVEELSCSVSLSPVTFRLSLLLILLLLSSNKHVEGQFQVIGPLEPIVVVAGDDVILPCRVEPQLDVAGETVEWSKPDLQPDPRDLLSRVEYVHVYRDTHEVPDMKMSSYVRRTSLFADGLRRGNISLKIINVTLADKGRYKCYIPKLQHSQVQSSIVHLVVLPDSAETKTTETPLQPTNLQTMNETAVNGGLSRRNRLISGVVVGALLILCVGVAVYLTKKCQKQEVHQSSQRYLLSRCLVDR